MPRKFANENTKVTAAKERKAAAQSDKDAKLSEEREHKASVEWSRGAKDTAKREVEQAKRAEKLARKTEAKKLLESELKEIESKRLSREKANLAPPPRPAQVASYLSAAVEVEAKKKKPKASKGEILTQKSLNTSDQNKTNEISLAEKDTEVGISEIEENKNKKSGLIHSLTLAALDRHPEKRAHAAWLLFSEREMTRMRDQYPNTRRSTLSGLLRKEWLISPENPMNKSMLSYNSTLEYEANVLSNLKISCAAIESENRNRESEFFKRKV